MALPPHKPTSRRQFWTWFKIHEQEIFNYKNNLEAIFDAIAEQLAKVNSDLSFEIGPKKDGIREFVISASGISSAFLAVRKLADEAPCFTRWKITAFRPRQSLDTIIKLGDRQVSSSDVQFSLLNNGSDIGIYLFIPKFEESDTTLKQIGYLFLDQALGEFDVETKVRLIRMFRPEEKTQGERYPLIDLPSKFDHLSSIIQ